LLAQLTELFHAEMIESGVVDELLVHTKMKDVEILLSIAIALNNMASNRIFLSLSLSLSLSCSCFFFDLSQERAIMEYVADTHSALIQKGAVKVLEKLYASRDQDIHQEAAEALFELHPESSANS
jgi:hypothetical protein